MRRFLLTLALLVAPLSAQQWQKFTGYDLEFAPHVILRPTMWNNQPALVAAWYDNITTPFMRTDFNQARPEASVGFLLEAAAYFNNTNTPLQPLMLQQPTGPATYWMQPTVWTMGTAETNAAYYTPASRYWLQPNLFAYGPHEYTVEWHSGNIRPRPPGTYITMLILTPY